MTEKLKAVHKYQGRLMDEHYQRALRAKEEGHLVAYVTALFPVEIVKAFEPHLVALYPENHAALMIARGQSQLVRRAEAEGLDRMGCAYELYHTGYHLNGHGRPDTPDLLDNKGRALFKLAEPDILLACDNQCRVICEWFKHISEMSGDKPYKMINAGDRFEGLLDRERVDYVKNQLEELIKWLEEQTGTDLDRDYLLSVADKAKQANFLWQEYLDLGAKVPSPVTAFDGFSHMALIVSERGKDQAVDYYEKLIEATLEAEKQNIYPVKEERHRLLWDNLATWYNFRELQNFFADNGIAVVGSTYLDAWRKDLDTSDYDALLESMAVAYSTIYTNMTIPQRISHYIEMVEKFTADGVLFHKNIGCHTFSLRVEEIADRLEKHFGKEFRSVVFEGCQGIEGRFQKHAFETGVTVHFIER